MTVIVMHWTRRRKKESELQKRCVNLHFSWVDFCIASNRNWELMTENKNCVNLNRKKKSFVRTRLSLVSSNHKADKYKAMRGRKMLLALILIALIANYSHEKLSTSEKTCAWLQNCIWLRNRRRKTAACWTWSERTSCKNKLSIYEFLNGMHERTKQRCTLSCDCDLNFIELLWVARERFSFH